MTRVISEENKRAINVFAQWPKVVQASFMAGSMVSQAIKEKESETGERVDQRNDQSPN